MSNLSIFGAGLQGLGRTLKGQAQQRADVMFKARRDNEIRNASLYVENRISDMFEQMEADAWQRDENGNWKFHSFEDEFSKAVDEMWTNEVSGQFTLENVRNEYHGMYQEISNSAQLQVNMRVRGLEIDELAYDYEVNAERIVSARSMSFDQKREELKALNIQMKDLGLLSGPDAMRNFQEQEYQARLFNADAELNRLPYESGVDAKGNEITGKRDAILSDPKYDWISQQDKDKRVSRWDSEEDRRIRIEEREHQRLRNEEMITAAELIFTGEITTFDSYLDLRETYFGNHEDADVIQINGWFKKLEDEEKEDTFGKPIKSDQFFFQNLMRQIPQQNFSREQLIDMANSGLAQELNTAGSLIHKDWKAFIEEMDEAMIHAKNDPVFDEVQLVLEDAVKNGDMTEIESNRLMNLWIQGQIDPNKTFTMDYSKDNAQRLADFYNLMDPAKFGDIGNSLDDAVTIAGAQFRGDFKVFGKAEKFGAALWGGSLSGQVNAKMVQDMWPTIKDLPDEQIKTQLLQGRPESELSKREKSVLQNQVNYFKLLQLYEDRIQGLTPNTNENFSVSVFRNTGQPVWIDSATGMQFTVIPDPVSRQDRLYKRPSSDAQFQFIEEIGDSVMMNQSWSKNLFSKVTDLFTGGREEEPAPLEFGGRDPETTVDADTVLSLERKMDEGRTQEVKDFLKSFQENK
jgi:hypothetical protein